MDNAKRPHMFVISSSCSDGSNEQERHQFSAENESELEEWMGGFHQLFVDIGKILVYCQTAFAR